MININNLNFKFSKDYYTIFNCTLKILDNTTYVFEGNDEIAPVMLMRIIAKLEKTYSGDILINNENIKKINYKHYSKLGFISSFPGFFENKTVEYNLKYPLIIRKVKNEEINLIVDNIIKSNNLENIKDKKLKDLNNLERTIINILRPSTRDIKYLLIDNIFKNLNEKEISTIFKILKSNYNFENTTIVINNTNNFHYNIKDYINAYTSIFCDNGSIKETSK